MRRIQEVAMLDLDGEDLSVNRIATWDGNSDSFEVLPRAEDREAFATWAGISVDELAEEVEKREAFLSTLVSTGVTAIPEVNAAIESFYEESIRPRPQA